MARWPAIYFDGETARPHRIEVEIGASELTLLDDRGVRARWGYAGLRRVHGSNRGSAMIEVSPTHSSDERLRLDDAAAVRALRAAHPKVDKKPPANRSAIKRALLWTGAAIGAMAFIVFVAVPALAPQIAALIPQDKEIALGNQVEELIRRVGLIEETCETPEGRAALDKMVAKLSVGLDLRIPIRADVVDSPIINAIALPGGRVLLFSPLLSQAKSAEEVAGVLAHEIGHVQMAHPTREAIRSSASAGVIGLFFGDFMGAGVMAGVGERLMNASYTRDAERDADQFAVERLAAANASSEPMAGFFRRFRERGGDGGLLGGYLASHPSFAEREAMLVAASVGDTAEPILSAKEWYALRGICDGESADTEDEGEDGEGG